MVQVKQPKTEALKKFQTILQGMVTDCMDAIGDKVALPMGRFYELEGKLEVCEIVLSLLEQLGPQVEDEAYELGYEQGEQDAYDNPKKPLGY